MADEQVKSVDIGVTPVFGKLHDAFNFNYEKHHAKRIIVLEGSSGSSKTTSIIQILIQYCFINQGKRKKITAARAKYSWCKDSILKDFIDKLVEYGLYDEKCHVRTHPQSYKLYSNEISFIGLDDPQRFHGPRQDITWINEAMEADQDSYRQLEMRTNECMILDYNPSYTQHWIFDTILSNLAGKKNTFYFRSTFRDNPFLPKGQRDTILSYEPTPQNIKNGTADEYKWRVYGLGERAAQKGTIFKYVTWIDRFPENVDSWYAIDFGYTIDPTAIVRGGIDGENLYLQKMLYEPIDNPDALADTLNNIGINRYDIIFADSADRYNDKEFIKDLRALGFNIKGISKTKGVVYWIGQLKKYKIHIVESVEFRIEQENYRWKEINGMQINQPIDKFNHCFSPDTKIATAIGCKNIIDIKHDDYVLTRNGFKKVLNSFCSGTKQLYNYDIDFGFISITVKCTENHKFLTDKGWKQISEITVNDKMFLNKHLMVKRTVSTMEKTTFQGVQKDYTGLFGNFIMVKYLTGLIFTIKTKIRGIILSKTLNLLKQVTTSRSTLKKELRKIEFGLRTSEKQGLNQQKNGIHLQKVLSGTGIMLKRMGLATLLMVQENVLYVILNLLQTLITKYSVLTTANLNTEGIAALIQSQRYANTVMKNFKQTNTAPQPVAVEVAVKSIVSKPIGLEPVYDLTVEDQHEFFANGILAHNCWDASRYLLMGQKANRFRMW